MAAVAIPEIPKRPGVEAVEWNLSLDALDLHIPHPDIKVSRLLPCGEYRGRWMESVGLGLGPWSVWICGGGRG